MRQIVRIKKEYLYFLAYGIFMMLAILSTSLYYQYYYGARYSLMLIGCMLLLIVGEVSNGGCLTIQKSVVFVLSVAIYILIVIANRNIIGTVALIPAFVYCGRNIEFSKISRYTLRLSVVLFVFVIVSSKLGVINSFVIQTASGRSREYLGFRYALYPSALLFNISAMILYEKQAKIRWIDITGLGLLNYWIYLKTNSRLSFCLTLLVIVIAAVEKIGIKKTNKRHFSLWVLQYSFIICAAVSAFVIYAYSSGAAWAGNLDSLLGNRVQYAAASLAQNGVSILGRRIEWVGFGLDPYGAVQNDVFAHYNYVDCMYIQVLQSYGILLAIVYIVLMTLCMKSLYKKGEYLIIIILSLIAFRNMIDDLSLYLYYNTFWLVLNKIITANKFRLKFELSSLSEGLARQVLGKVAGGA
ncbi:MAG: hypothetical protein IJJ25_07300 [Lachnospiraceae bacterium]|nr:hypothetical protein [Lachnospiraceae bacterium]